MKVVNLCASGESVTKFSVLAFLQAYSSQKKLGNTLRAGSHF